MDLRGRLEAENGLKLTGTILPQNMSIKIAPGSVVQRLRCGPSVHKVQGSIPVPASGKARFFFSLFHMDTKEIEVIKDHMLIS